MSPSRTGAVAVDGVFFGLGPMNPRHTRSAAPAKAPLAPKDLHTCALAFGQLFAARVRFKQERASRKLKQEGKKEGPNWASGSCGRVGTLNKLGKKQINLDAEYPPVWKSPKRVVNGFIVPQGNSSASLVLC